MNPTKALARIPTPPLCCRTIKLARNVKWAFQIHPKFTVFPPARSTGNRRTVVSASLPAVASDVSSAGLSRSPKQDMLDSLEANIEKVIYGCRFFAILAVCGSLVGSFLCFFKGCTYIVSSFRDYFLDRGKVMTLLVEATDVYLLGTVMLVFGMGLYELFISNLDKAKSYPDGSTTGRSSLFGLFVLKERPRWLEIKTVNELKTKLGHVIVMLLLIGLFDKSKKAVIQTPADLLCFSASTQPVILSSLRREKRKETRTSASSMAAAKKNAYSAAEMEELTAVCDTFLPSIDVSDHHLHPSLTKFYQTSASMTQTPELLAELLGEKIKHPKIYLSRLALCLLATRLGTFILCGTKSLSAKFPYFQRFSRVSPHQREQIMLSWSDSCFSLLRILYCGLKIFTLLVFFTQVNDGDENVSWKAIGYCRPDLKDRKHVIRSLPQSGGHEKTRERGEECWSNKDRFGPLYNGIVNFNQSKELACRKLEKLGFPVSIPESDGAKFKSSDPSFVIKCDVVVVGSGSGGGVVAGVLAEAGYKVLVLEKGSYLARSNLSLLEGQAIDQMYLGNGVLGTDNMDVLLLAGSTVGGGSTINWSASIRTPPHIRKEWSENYKLEMFGGQIYENALNVVCEKMGVQSEFDREGFNSMILRRGCEKLGYPVETIPCNAPTDHYCGCCNLGCKDGKKKGVSETWLVDLVESGNGAILTECKALKVIVRQKRAHGVVFVFENSRGEKQTAVIESKITVAACGAICTPPLLKRSGLKNRNIGKNLHLHPVVNAWGYFPDFPSSNNNNNCYNNAWPEAEKRSYEGAIMTAMSRVKKESSGYSTVIQTPALHPGMFSALMPWLSGQDIKDRMCKYSRTAHLFTLVRDRGSGSVYSPDHVSYKMDGADRENLRGGIEMVLRILAAAGAEEIGTHHKNGRALKVKEGGEEELERFVKEESLRALESNLSCPISSAHQMGSCRMGVDPRGSAVGPTGESWEVGWLFVADSSVFPTALGVNPMVTVMAIADCVAQCVLESLGGKKFV